MELKDEVVDPTEISDWDKKITSFREYTFFHTSAWARVIKEAYGYLPRYILINQKNENLAILPAFEINTLLYGKKGVALPFSDHCQLLIRENISSDDVMKAVKRCALDMKWKTLEFRGGNETLIKHPAVAKYNLHKMDLSYSDNELKKRLRDSTWRNIKKALKNDVTITIDNKKTSLDSFYNLHCLTRKRHGIPPQPYKFFAKIQEIIHSKNSGVTVLARKNKKIIAGAIFFHVGDYATYKYGASDREYFGLRANNLVMWEAIKYYQRQSFRILDLGRSEQDNIGLNQFKNGWGTTIKTLPYYRYKVFENVFIDSKNRKVKREINALSLLPTPVLRLIGKIAYRHIT